MKPNRCLATCLGLLAAALLCPDAHAAAGPFDGRWSVALVCPDTTGKKGAVKGYEFDFDVLIAEGTVQGSYGAPGHPASVVWTGRVADDGALELAASGNTGQPDYTIGKVTQGTQYGYTMQGTLAGSAGKATRRELRPCTATFTKR